MKGFKNSTKTKIGHDFPADCGFTGSAGKISVKPHMRSTPTRQMNMGGKACYAGGGLVGHHDNPSKFAENMNWSDYKKGGRVKKGMGGRMGAMPVGMAQKTAPAISAPLRRGIQPVMAGRGRVFKKGGPVHSDEAQDKKLIKKMLKAEDSKEGRLGHKHD